MIIVVVACWDIFIKYLIFKNSSAKRFITGSPKTERLILKILRINTELLRVIFTGADRCYLYTWADLLVGGITGQNCSSLR